MFLQCCYRVGVLGQAETVGSEGLVDPVPIGRHTQWRNVKGNRAALELFKGLLDCLQMESLWLSGKIQALHSLRENDTPFRAVIQNGISLQTLIPIP